MAPKRLTLFSLKYQGVFAHFRNVSIFSEKICEDLKGALISSVIRKMINN